MFTEKTNNLNSLYKIQYGMYVITSTYNMEKSGQIVTVVFQVTSEPIQLAVCLAKNTYTHELIEKSKVLGISILEETTPAKFIGSFGYRCGKNCDKFCEVNFKIGTATKCPLVIDNALVIMEAEVKQTLDLHTHNLFICELKNIEELRVGKAMTYEYYHTVHKGKSPKNAPTYFNLSQESGN